MVQRQLKMVDRSTHQRRQFQTHDRRRWLAYRDQYHDAYWWFSPDESMCQIWWQSPKIFANI